MEWDQVAGIEPPVDEQAVQQQIESYVAGNNHVGREPWTITTLGQANWALQRLGEAEAVTRRYADEIALWTSAARRLRLGAGWLEDRLKEWGVVSRTRQTKSFSLAHGTVSTRETPARIVVADEAVAIEWARAACPDAIKREEALLVSRLDGAARIVDVVVGYDAIHGSTGEVQRLKITMDAWRPVDAMVPQLEDVRSGLDGWTVTQVTVAAVVDVQGVVVPGLAVKPGEVTATVKALGV